MRLLNLNLHREFFCAVLDGSKKVEYRDRSDYWEKRLKDKDFTHIRFRNGYRQNAPELTVALKEIVETSDYFELHLGKLTETKNIES